MNIYKSLLVESFFSSITLSLITFLLIDLLVVRMQLYILPNYSALPTLLIRIMLFLSFAIHVINRKTIFYKVKIVQSLIIFCSSAILTVILCIYGLINEFSPAYLLYGIYSYYFIFIIAIVLSNIDFSFISIKYESKFRGFLLITSLPIMLFGIIQYYLSASFLPLNDQSGAVLVASVQFGIKIRAFSLFSSALNFGHYCCFIACLSLVTILKSRSIIHKAFTLTTFFASCVAVYSTITRAAYIEFALSILSVLILVRYMRLMKFVPLVYFVVAILIAVYAKSLSGFLSGDVSNDFSINLRYDQWSSYLSQLYKSRTLELFFGTGYIQSGNTLFEDKTRAIIDNTFFAVLIQLGIFGLLTFLFLIYRIYHDICEEIKMGINILTISCTSIASVAVLSTYLARSIFNVEFNSFSLMILMFYIFKVSKRRAL